MRIQSEYVYTERDTSTLGGTTMKVSEMNARQKKAFYTFL